MTAVLCGLTADLLAGQTRGVSGCSWSLRGVNWRSCRTGEPVGYYMERRDHVGNRECGHRAAGRTSLEPGRPPNRLGGLALLRLGCVPRLHHSHLGGCGCAAVHRRSPGRQTAQVLGTVTTVHLPLARRASRVLASVRAAIVSELRACQPMATLREWKFDSATCAARTQQTLLDVSRQVPTLHEAGVVSWPATAPSATGSPPGSERDAR